MSIALSILLIVGIVLLARGLRGRPIDDHPLCGRCGFDLLGLPPDTFRCSECGADLYAPNPITVGHRDRRRRTMLLGIVVSAIASCGLGTQTYISTQNIDLLQYEPLWMVQHSARSTTPTASSNRALSELQRRSTAGELSAGQLNDIIDAALSEQQNAKMWDPRWGELVESAHENEHLDAARWHRYLHQALRMKLVVRPRVRRGDPVPYTVSTEIRRANRSFDIRMAPRHRIDKVADDFHGDGPSLSWRFAGGYSSAQQPDPALFDRLREGEHTFELVTVVSLHDNRRSLPAEEFEVSLDARWILLPASEKSVTPLVDPVMIDAVKRAISPEGFEIRTGTDSLYGRLVIDTSPAPLAFDVYLRLGSIEQKLNATVQVAANSTKTSYAIYQDVPGLYGDRFDLVLRPSAAAAAASVELDQYFNHEIVLEGVPFTHSPATR